MKTKVLLLSAASLRVALTRTQAAIHYVAAVRATCLIGACTASLYAAAFSDDNWTSVGDVLNDGPLPRQSGGVSAMGSDGSGDVIIGGPFTIAGNVFATNIAKWNRSSWSALGSGMDGVVYTLAVSGGDLYAGGYFATAGGMPANSIAKWNRSNWSALGSGLNNFVYALAVSGSNVYAGGGFISAGGIPANHIANWNGTSWSALGSGVNGTVFALAVSGSDLYAAGEFTTAGGNVANYIARWDGTGWSAVGSGMDGIVYTLAVSGGDLYAGGGFLNAGGVAANKVAKWDGANWSALGSGVSGPDNDEDYSGGWVSTLAVLGSALYTGGHFTTAGGVSANNIAKWDGSSWSALGSGIDGYGLNPPVWALAVSANNLYAGGYFWTAGGKPSQNLVKARIGSIAKAVATSNSTATTQFSGVTGYQYDVQRATNLNSPSLWNTITTSPLSPAPDGSFTFTDTNAPPGAAFYRARELP